MDEHRIARPRLAVAVDDHGRGQALEHHRRRLIVANFVGQFEQARRRHVARLRIGAGVFIERPADAHIGGALPHLNAFGAGAHFFDDAGGLVADDHRELQWLGDIKAAAADIHIGIIDGDGAMAEAHLTGARRRQFGITPLQYLRPAVCVDLNGLRHASP